MKALSLTIQKLWPTLKVFANKQTGKKTILLLKLYYDLDKTNQEDHDGLISLT